MARLLEAIFDPLFSPRSYGFRRDKTAHQAIGRLYESIVLSQETRVVVEMDIEKFFDSMSQSWLVQWIESRIVDPKLLRLLRILLRADVLKEGVPHPTQGTVTFLGFEFYWGRAAKRAKVLKLKTQPKRLSRSMSAFTDWIKTHRNRMKLDKLWQLAATKLRGHFNYYGVRSNSRKLAYFYHHCAGALFKWLNRRSQKRSFTWERFERQLRFHPLPRIRYGKDLRDVSSEHNSVKHKPKSRMREIRTSGSVRSAGLGPVFT
jgi:ribonuclease HI